MAVLFGKFDVSEPLDVAAQKRTGPFSPKNKTALVSWLINKSPQRSPGILKANKEPAPALRFAGCC